MKSLGALLAERGPERGVWFVEDPPGPATHPVGTRFSWEDLANRAARVAGALRERGIRRGDTLAIVLPTTPEFLDALFGCMLAGAVPVPLYPPVRLGRLEEYQQRTVAMLQAAQAKMVLTDSRIWRILGPVMASLRPSPPCLEVGQLQGTPLVDPGNYEDLALIQFSSGTTVHPKPVALSHRNILSNIQVITETVVPLARITGHHTAACWLPLYHDMGLIGCLLSSLFHPADLHLMRPEQFVMKPALWLRTLSRSQAVISPAPNFAYALCVDRIRDGELEGVDLRNWRCALNGAEPVAPSTLRRFVERFSAWGLRPEALTPVYGLSECSLAVSFGDFHQPFRSERFSREDLSQGEVRPEPGGVELVSVGRPLRDIEVEAPENRIGPIRVKGLSVMQGYYLQPERTAEAIQDGWLNTGDLGFFYEGELYVTGRAKDLIIIRGRNHSPSEVELLVDGVPGVRTGCSAAVGHLREGEETESLVVFVEVQGGAEASETMVDACRKAILQGAGLDATVLLLEAGTLPRTSSGKIRRAEALRQWLSGELLPPNPVTPWLIAKALLQGTVAQWRVRAR